MDADPTARSGAGEALTALRALTRRLRSECPWDREQTTISIVPHTVEEAYEVADAAMAGDEAGLVDELGDLLFQVVFLAQLLEERGAGDLEEVIRSVHAKLVRRHPHVFGEAEATTARRVKQRWEELKAEQEGRDGVFHDVPGALPALLHARKVQRRAATVGFDWDDLDGPRAKVREELAELEQEIASAGPVAAEVEPHPGVAWEIGDLLFAVVNLARKLNVDPELALRSTTTRFVDRVEEAERVAAERGEHWIELPYEDKERDYQVARSRLGTAPHDVRGYPSGLHDEEGER